jgi:hypothetical protein
MYMSILYPDSFIEFNNRMINVARPVRIPFSLSIKRVMKSIQTKIKFNREDINDTVREQERHAIHDKR